MDMGKGCIVTVLSWWAMTTLSFISDAYWWKSTTPQFYLLHSSCLQFTIFIFLSGGLCWRSLNYACSAFDSLYERCDAFFTFILIRDTPRGAWTLSILWLVAPCRKEIQYPGQLISLFHVNLIFHRHCPAVDWYLCSVDMDSRQIRGHYRVRRWQLIHHTVHYITKSAQTFSPKACSLPWYHIQSIHYRGGWQRQFNPHTATSLASPCEDQQDLLAECYQHKEHVTSLMQTGKKCV